MKDCQPTKLPTLRPSGAPASAAAECLVALLLGTRSTPTLSITNPEHPCTEPPMKVQGSCHCGQVTYEAEIDPDSVHICNCTDCQLLTGSAFRVSVHAPKATFRLLTGQPKVYIKVADSGTKRRHSFCRNCGTPVNSSADTDNPPTYSLRVGCLKQRAQLSPKKRNWCRSALAWAQNISTLPARDTQ